MIRPAELIERKRDGGQLSAEEWNELMLGYARDEVPDYQLAALAMAVFFRGLTPEETYDLTNAMIATGDTVDLHSALGRKVVDKHSTGGVGDKTSIAVGPIVAACGVPFAKMSGRGLGHTGGTLDKLESIPGFRVELSIDEFVAQVRDAGMAIIGASANLVPADKKLYALRDVTATVDNYSLIAASIMSKKIAGGADAIVIDAKVGDGAFMKSTDDARALAEAMLDLGERSGREVVCLLTDMDQPLGRAVGNALEIREAIATVKGEARARPTSSSSCSRRPRGCWRSPIWASTSRRGEFVRCRRLPTARPSRPTSAGSGRRAAIPPRTRWRPRRSSIRSPLPARATSPSSARSLSARRRSISEPGAGRRRTRSTTQSGSCSIASAATGWPRAKRSRRSTPPPMRPPTRWSPSCSPRTRSRTTRRPSGR